MASPPKGQMRPSRYLFALVAIFVLLYGIVLGTGTGSMGNRLKPKLGLDLVGGTTLTLVAKSPDGQPPSPANLETSRQIIEKRVNDFGVSEAEVVTDGDRNILVSVPGINNEKIKDVGRTSQLRFRTVLAAVLSTPVVTPSPSPSASVSPSAKPAASTGPSAKPAATVTPTTSTAATASPSPSPTAAPDTAKQRAELLARLGPAAKTAEKLPNPDAVNANPGLVAALAPFATLTPAEIALLPAHIQYVVPQIDCTKLNSRPPGSIESVDEQVVACEGSTKFLLDKSHVVGTDVESAAPQYSQMRWVVALTFSGDGSKKWQTLTSAAYNQPETTCPAQDAAGGATNAQGDGGTTGKPHCRVAVVLDNEVISAPEIQAVMTSESEISGSFTRDSASQLANDLKYGALPVSFDQGDLSSVSATLGTDYLKAGLLAAGIGMLLVIIYSFFYYRLLGSVIFGSLILSALLTFGMLALLGRQIGFALTLAGIAGFIVSLGVAADSFVIYFERLKDEIREGRSPRSAIPRAWQRARRTIITANAVTILAAVVLYLVGIGSVRGFAFALGLATSLDLVIVFLFRHPIMTLLANTPAFLSPRVSGLGRVLNQSNEAQAKRSGRAKEA